MDNVMMNQAQAALSAGAAKLPGAHAGMNMTEIKEAAEAFEAFYLAQALEPMFANTTPSGPFSGGPGEEMWRSLQIQEYGKALAQNGGIGLADSVMAEMVKMQERGQQTMESPAP